MHRLKHGICRRFVIHCRYADAEIQNLRAPITFTTSKNENHSEKKIYECRAMKEDGGSYLSLIRPIAALSRALGTLGSRNAVIEAPSGEKKTRRTELQLLDGSRFSVFLFSIIGLKTNIHYTLHYLSSSYSWSQESTFLNNYLHLTY